MKTLMIKDLPQEEKLDAKAMSAVTGGMMKLPFQRVSTNQLLTTPDGDPISVYVDGVLINSASDGYVHL